MNAPTKSAILAPVVATLAALAVKRAVPSTFAVDPKTPGLAGVIVSFAAPTKRPTPTVLRTAFDDSITRAIPNPGACVPDLVNDATKFLASLPDVVSPVAALGLAVRIAVEPGTKWVHNGTREGSSRWTYCASSIGNVNEGGARIVGADDTTAEANANGNLTIDAAVPSHIAATLRTAYAEARGVVEPSRVVALVAAHLVRKHARVITSDLYLLPAMDPVTCGVLAGLVDLGGWAEVFPLADPARIARLTGPVTKSIEEQIADVIKNTQEFITKAKAVAAWKPDPTKPDDKAPALQARTAQTAREQIAEARAAAMLWRDRLGLASLDVDAQLNDLDAAADAADDAAQKEQAKRRENAKIAKELAKLNTPSAGDLAALDESDAVTAKRAAKASKGGAA